MKTTTTGRPPLSPSPPQSLPPDAFVLAHDRQSPASGVLPFHLGSATNASAAPAGQVNSRHTLASQSIALSHSSFNHNDASSHPGTNGPGFDAMSPQLPVRPGQIQFRSNTISPSPPLPEPIAEEGSGSSADDSPYSPSPLGARGLGGLAIATDIPAQPLTRTDSHTSNYGLSSSAGRLQHKSSSASLKPISRTPSIKQAFAYNIGSACSSAVTSPMISAMGDVTPLPSPLLLGDSPGPWKKLGARPPSRDANPPPMAPDSVLITASGESVSSALANQAKRKVYQGLKDSEATDGGHGAHGRHRSISEYVPDPMSIPKRQTTVSGPHGRPGRGNPGETNHHMRREANLSISRGLTPAAKPPTPPPSESSQSNDGPASQMAQQSRAEYFEAYGKHDKKLRRWRAVKQLGEGTFSRVMLATSQIDGSGSATNSELDLKTLVAVKVCEHGPRGGASETRIEMSLKRELEIMRSIHHPSLVHLKAWNIEPTRALLVLSYCPGGDLFDVATAHRDLLTPSLLRRMFAELVGAVKYLHDRRIVHRDIKLENVLVNIPARELANPHQDWQKYPDSIITLTDLGLSRFVADDEKLETRCGSDDYAAPEVILGQPYDGRAIDAWSMGVLLYALLESRLPFDPPPGASDAHRMRSRTSHRIARVEWRWIEYAGEDGDHDGDEAKFAAKGLQGAMEVTEGLLKRARSRWPLDKVAQTEWVRGGIQVEGGPKFKQEDEGQEVL